MPLALFDLDNTLIDRYAAFDRWATDFLAAHGLAPAEKDRLTQLDGEGFTPRPEFFGAVRDRYGLADPVDGLVTGFRVGFPRYVVVDPAVPQALAGLRAAGWRVGIVTNGTNLGQNAKVDRAGLRDVVDAVCVSEAAGVPKPDRAIFDLAARMCGVGAREPGWMVGDCPVRDIGGARSAGLRTIWIHWNRPWPDGSPAPDHRVGSPLAAIDYLAGRGAARRGAPRPG